MDHEKLSLNHHKYIKNNWLATHPFKHEADNKGLQQHCISIAPS